LVQAPLAPLVLPLLELRVLPLVQPLQPRLLLAQWLLPPS